MNFKALESSKIKNRYFYRTEKWDWLTKEHIHVLDSKSPRIITMDPWPQKIFLEALGQQTISDYVYNVAQEYPKNKIPEELDDVILEMIESLLSEEKIISLSDKPVNLKPEILNPINEEGEINMQGEWFGTYQYNMPEEFKDERLINVDFTLTIDSVKGNRFTGKVQDHSETGGTPGIGIIRGTFNDDKIEFRKNMPIKSRIDEYGNHIIDESKKHTTLYYKGTFSKSKKIVTGTWKFKKTIFFWKGIVPHLVSLGNGTFSMKKKD